MSDPVKLAVPAAAPYRSLGADVSGRYLALAGASESEVGAFVAKITEALDRLAGQVPDTSNLDVVFVTGPTGVEATVTCQGQSLVVTHAVHARQN